MNGKPVALYAAIALSATAQASPPLTYSAGPISATVVDAVSGKPVEGAVVVAQWVLEGGAHVDRIDVLVVKEAVTDAEGRFRIEGWGPVSRPSRGFLDGLDPELLILKAGGQLGLVSNNTGGGVPGRRVNLERRDSIWNGAVVRIKHEQDEALGVEPSGRLFAAKHIVSHALKSTDCKWVQLPRAIAVLEKELNRVGRAPLEVTGNYYLARTDCGQLAEFRKAYEEMSKK